jgi:hypothetical protein
MDMTDITQLYCQLYITYQLPFFILVINQLAAQNLQGESSSLCWIIKGKQLCKGIAVLNTSILLDV